MRAAVAKIQILTDRSLGLPLFYCHRDDRDHEPELVLEQSEDGKALIVRARQMLYKVKQNPQSKNRVDIYMSLPQARGLGLTLQEATAGAKSEEWPISKAQPAAKATGNMKLPRIVWSRASQCIRVAARVRSGFAINKRDSYVNIDLEYPGSRERTGRKARFRRKLLISGRNSSTRSNMLIWRGLVPIEIEFTWAKAAPGKIKHFWDIRRTEFNWDSQLKTDVPCLFYQPCNSARSME